MNRIYAIITLSAWMLLFCATSQAQDEKPSVDPKGSYVTIKGETIEDASTSQSAPLEAHFTANPENVGDYEARYEWKIYEEGKEDEPLVHRFEEDMDYTFTKSGSFCVQLYATFTLNGDTITYPEEGETPTPISVSICESKLEFPNVLSPNDDGYNDTYKPKDGYQSIVSFHAIIINRWGQKLYSWDDIDGEWDGKVNGKVVKDGVYYLVCNAKGADGKVYKIRKDINVITGYYNKDKDSSSDE